MDNFLLSIGWWNFGGSFIMLLALHPGFGKKLFNEWTHIFKEPFILDYWGKFWLLWAGGLNIFFGLVNILAVKWAYAEVKTFLAYTDLVAYSAFILLAVWGIRAGRCGSGIYSAFIIFSFWIGWACLALCKG